MCVCVSQTDGKHSGETTTRPSPFLQWSHTHCIGFDCNPEFQSLFSQLSLLARSLFPCTEERSFSRFNALFLLSPAFVNVSTLIVPRDLTGSPSFIYFHLCVVAVGDAAALSHSFGSFFFFFFSFFEQSANESVFVTGYTHTEEHLCQAVIERAEPGLLQSINRTGGETRVETLICDIPPLGAAVIV